MIRLSVLVSLVFPLLAFAAIVTDFKSLIRIFVDILNTAIPIIISLALLAFFWGVFLFVRNSDSGDEKGEGRRIMIWGIVALFVMTSFFGIVRIVQNTFFSSSSTEGSFYGNSPNSSGGAYEDYRVFPKNVNQPIIF